MLELKTISKTEKKTILVCGIIIYMATPFTAEHHVDATFFDCGISLRF